MERKTFIQFILISTLILGVWWLGIGLLYGWKRPVAPPAPQEPPRQVTQRPETPREESPVALEPAPPEKEIGAVSGLILRNDLLSTSWTNRGAALERVQLLQYRAPYHEKKNGKERPVLTLIKEFEPGYLSDVLESVTLFPLGGGEQESSSEDIPTAGILYQVVDKSEDRIVFEGELDPRLMVRKSVSIEPGAYHFEVTLEFVNRTESDLEFSYRLRGAAGIEREIIQSISIATAVGRRKGAKYSVKHFKASKIIGVEKKAREAEGENDARKRRQELENLLNESTNILWAGTVNHSFAALTQPLGSDWVKLVESRSVSDTDMLEARGRWKTLPPRYRERRFELARSGAVAIIHSTPLRLEPGQSIARRYRFISAPKLDRTLEPYKDGMTNVVRFGLFPSLSRLMLSILKFFHSVIPNYGVAIILLTIVVRVALHPLARKTQVSMHKMQQLQPRIAELRKKFGDDKQKFAQEQMALFRKYGVHPMSGCLPMLVQLPVLIALFGTLRNAVELRHAMFIPGWITDLSAPDTIFHLPFAVPMLGSGVNVLPFLMVGSMLLSQRFQPKPADPQARQQQQLYKWMPLIFAVMFYGLASGLLLYWTVSTMFGVLEMWRIRKRLAGVKIRPVGEAEKPKRGVRAAKPKKPGFFGRLMQQLEDQEKRSGQARSRKTKKRS